MKTTRVGAQARPRADGQTEKADDRPSRETSPRTDLGRVDEIVIGKLMGIAEQGEPLVDFPDNPARHPLMARSTVDLTHEHIGREVALLFETGKLTKPIVMGLLRIPKPLSQSTAEIDGERLELSAEREIVLRCGEASITLTRAGKILLRGKYLLSRSSGVNRIKGGSIQLN